MIVRCGCSGLCGQDVPVAAAEFCGNAGVAVSRSAWFIGTSAWASQGSVAAALGRANGAGPLDHFGPTTAGECARARPGRGELPVGGLRSGSSHDFAQRAPGKPEHADAPASSLRLLSGLPAEF